MYLTHEEVARYQRQLNLKEISVKGQTQLKSAKVLCIGAGGLGSAVISYLTAAGIGTIGIADHDIVDTSNLQRQILYSDTDVGRPKVEAAQKWIRQHNPFVEINTYLEKISSKNIESIIHEYDLIIDGTDNFSTRFLINDACVLNAKPFISASIYQFEGQLSFFVTEEDPCYRCLYHAIPANNDIADCATAGVLGVLPGLLGIMQATEALKYFLKIGDLIQGKLVYVDSLSLSVKTFQIDKNPHCLVCGRKPKITQLEAENYLSNKAKDNNTMTVDRLKDLLPHTKTFFIVDVRNKHELIHSPAIKGALNIPLETLENNLNLIPKDKLCIVNCQKGYRSLQAVNLLRQRGFDAVSLEGGIEAWEELSSINNDK